MPLFKVGFCVSAHGYGHAARAVAVMESLSSRINVHCTVASLVPEWFFRRSFSGSLSVYPVQNDIGLVQLSALDEDLQATLTKLKEFYPLAPDKIEELAAIFSDCDLVVSDIAPGGIIAAEKAHVPSLLLENFTWDWIYREYLPQYPGLAETIDYIQEAYALAQYHIQAQPVCNALASDLRVEPVARKIRSSKDEIRARLGLNDSRHLVLVTMGGAGIEDFPLDLTAQRTDTVFVIPGMDPLTPRPENIFVLPGDSGIYHPDLVAASEAVIGKVGYSTLAEIYHADIPYGYVPRPFFPESEPLVRFIRDNMTGMEITAGEFRKGNWVNMLPDLISMNNRPKKQLVNGADQCAEFIVSLLRVRDSTGR